MQLRILVEGGDLVVQVAQAFLQRQHQEAVHFALVFIELRRWQGGCARLRIAAAGQGEAGRLVRIVRNLEAAVVGAEHGTQAGIVIEKIRQVAERFVLACLVVQRIARVLRIFHAQRIAQVAAGQIVIELADAAEQFGARFDMVVAANQDADAPARRQAALLGFDIDDAGRAQAELGRQGAGHEIGLVNQASVDRLAEAADAFRQLHAVDAVLHVRMVVAHVQGARAFRILRHTWQAQQHFIERRVVALAQHVDHMAVDAVDGGAHFRRQFDARAAQVGRGDFDGLHFLRRCLIGMGGNGKQAGNGERQRAQAWSVLHGEPRNSVRQAA